MVHIIRTGKLPEAQVYEVTCPKCKTLFSFLRGEARTHHARDQRDNSYLEIGCPLPGCGTTVTKDLDYNSGR